MSLFNFSNKPAEGERKSYSQSGEDLIISYLFENYLKIPKPVYVDIGAHHPTYISNTFLFYENGSCGMCVEADPFLCELIRKKRPRDICLNVGAAAQSGTADFYIMTPNSLNTFSREEALRFESYGANKIEKIVQLPLLGIKEIIVKLGAERANFISLDVEGLDLSILQAFDWAVDRPEVFCVETLIYTEDKTARKRSEIISFMVEQGYFVYADTWINTIFVDCIAWERR